jgi:hypothetical protein
MVQPSNIPLQELDETPAYFNNYFSPNFVLSQNVDDAVIGYFEKITDNKDSARLLAGSLIYTALAQGLDPMELLAQFTKLPAGQLNGYLTMFLNLNRVGTSLLGINNVPIANKYIARTILL